MEGEEGSNKSEDEPKHKNPGSMGLMACTSYEFAQNGHDGD
jgi:hypothetical protein